MRHAHTTTTTTEMVVVSDVPPVTKEAVAAIAKMAANEAVVGTVYLTDTEFAELIYMYQGGGGV